MKTPEAVFKWYHEDLGNQLLKEFISPSDTISASVPRSDIAEITMKLEPLEEKYRSHVGSAINLGDGFIITDYHVARGLGGENVGNRITVKPQFSFEEFDNLAAYFADTTGIEYVFVF